MNDFSKICYSHETGVFTWAVSGKGIAIGRVAGCKNADGYWQIKINRQIYAAHRLAWRIEKGEWPVGEIDHIDGDPLNNRISNLRVVSREENSQNRRRPMKNKTSCELLGAFLNKKNKTWYSQIWANGVRHCLGSFRSAIEAHQAYLRAKSVLHISNGS